MYQKSGFSSTYKRKKAIFKNWELYLLILPPVVYFIVFHYIPMGGILIAFKDYSIRLGVIASPWAGFKYFEQFFSSPMFWPLIRNTLTLSVYSIVAGFPAPIILAIALNEVKNGFFRRLVQTVTYAPYFISMVVLVGIIMQVLAYRGGLINPVIVHFGGQPINFMGMPELFQSIYVFSGVWQTTGYSAIIYLAALSSIDPNLHEAAKIDGCTNFQKVRYIDLPGIKPTIVILLILTSAGILHVGFEKVFLMQNNLNLRVSEVIATYVYKVGIGNVQYSFATAVGVFNSFINFTLIMIVNAVAKKVGETSLW